ncbi:benzoyl-CoA reductase subunit C [Paramagnetospirillum marisnigri]|uniref:Benzoyl-CoA reductase subunit C n=1 Tax=Paramagnetospirillum marisnigri TaxID=1285242 RepID=A0A178MMN1_9PROT|nr:benzoyl-CoA reductase subunit C [Paramagnetospirillum marisnigri]OAN49941.1 benzoyl-CoA reductase subunit C [Paramagnetospirillum marisnigri]
MSGKNKTVADIVAVCQEMFEDLQFNYARKWKAAKPGRKVIGFLPVYSPLEMIHAAGCLPLGIFGGGDQMEVIHGDAYYQSYICRIPRSTIELGVTGRLDFVDGMIFPFVCDVIRNLSGMWKLTFPNVWSKFFDTPQNYIPSIGGTYYEQELKELKEGLENLTGRKITDEDIKASIRLYNENRRLVREVYAFRAKEPWKAPTSEVYLLMRAGLMMDVAEHNQMLLDYLAAAKAEDRPKRDNVRIAIYGSFCEQPPLNLIKSIEMAGCYVVEDDYALNNRFLMVDVPTDGDPLAALSNTYIENSVETSCKYVPDGKVKGEYHVAQVKACGAEGVIYATPSFCDPALLDRPMICGKLSAEGIPYIAFKYAENSGQMQPIREQAGTFADSIKLWS